MINFPSSPSVGQVYTYLDLGWVCSHAGPPAVWRVIPNQGEASNISYVIGVVRTIEGILPATGTLNYV